MEEHEMTPNQFREWRKSSALSQTAAAKFLGVSLATIKSWEAGRRTVPPTIDLLARALAALGELSGATGRAERKAAIAGAKDVLGPLA